MSGKPVAIKLGDLVTNAKGGKYFPISSEEGGPAVWQPAEWLRILWHPSAYNGEEARRLPLCLEPREEACAELAALEKAVASQLSERSLDEPKLFGRRQTTSDVQERFVSCLKTSTRGNPFIKVKVLLDRVCLWDAEQRPLEEVRDLSNRMCKLRAELKHSGVKMGKVKLFPSQSFDVKQPRDPVVCRTPSNGILCAPSASGKTVLLVSMILEQYRGCFERVYIMSPSIDMDPQWEPVKEYIRKDLGVNTDREQCWWDEWDEGALRQILAQQKKITQQSKQLGMKKLYQVLVCLDDMADSPQVHKKTGDGILDTLFIRGRHYCINTWVSTQKLRLMPSAVRVNTMFYCVFRLRNQLELDALVEELSAMLPKDVLYGMYEEATREKYSFWYVNLRAPKEDMFWVRFDRKFLVNEHGDDPQPGGGEAAGERPGLRQ